MGWAALPTASGPSIWQLPADVPAEPEQVSFFDGLVQGGPEQHQEEGSAVNMQAGHLQPVDAAELPEYPLSADDRLDSHYFMVWERRRWLNSDMRLKGTPECRALYFDLTNIAYDQSPVGTLPDDLEVLAKMLFVEVGHFRSLCKLDYGPLHKWTRCICEGGEVRLMHPMVLKSLSEAIARKEDNRAKNEAANASKRLQRLRATVAGYHADLAKNDAAVRWMDEWLIKEGCEYRNATWVERAMQAWSNHMFDLGRARGSVPNCPKDTFGRS